ncbi:hypothetical protein [Sunxiuqinia rutila]|uniref:hypothetical protein n=1 Tax=Sunxiuqinia rutila TaxID=1397841 RepID=UPI003D364F42
MASENLVSVTFTDEERAQLGEHLAAIESILHSKCISLTPEERQEYARLGNKSENWSRKVIDYMNQQPNLTPAFIDLDETMNDYEARRALQPIAARGEAVMDMLNDTMMLLGSDLYHSCIAYYRNIRLLARQNVNGAKAIYEDLSAQFPGRPSKK